ncbi:MAG: helix-turn-helix domain-containing protein [Dysosmobacter sp.]
MRQTDTGALIAQLRKEQGLTQKQLAEQLHISDRTISKWERGPGFPMYLCWNRWQMRCTARW